MYVFAIKGILRNVFYQNQENGLSQLPYLFRQNMWQSMLLLSVAHFKLDTTAFEFITSSLPLTAQTPISRML